MRSDRSWASGQRAWNANLSARRTGIVRSVPFTLLPAVDVSRGRLGLYTPEGPGPSEAFEGDPVAAARAFTAAGARWLHVVDMDLAFSGAVGGEAVIGAIAAACPGARIQASGGVRTWAQASALLEAGATRVVLGSAALGDEEAARGVLARLGDRALVGIEVQEGRIRSRGVDPVDLDLMATVGWLVGLDVAGFLLTSVQRVAGLAGPDLEFVPRVARTGRPTLVAGGIATLEDLRAAREAGAVGAVVGRAALEGDLDLSEAFAWAQA